MVDAKTKPEPAPAAKPSSKPAPPKAAATTPPQKGKPVPVIPPETVLVETAFTTGWYWASFIIAFVSLWLLLIYYSPSQPLYILLPYWVAIALAIGLSIWSASGLLNRYKLFQRIGAGAAKFRDRETPEGAEDSEVVYRENIVVRVFKGIGRILLLLFLFVWNTVLRIVYIIELTILRAIILAYDIIYYLLYFAWATTYWAVSLALRIVRWALRVAWKILRILTRLPLARYLWDKKLMPKIMGRWNARMTRIRTRRAERLETKRRLVAAKGLDPDKWQKDQEARHHFFLPHPHDARKGLRERIEERQKLDYNRRDRWTAFRKGQPIPPKLHSERKKRKQEEKAQKKREAREGKRADKKRGKGEDKSDKKSDEKAAADAEIAKGSPKKEKPEKPSKRAAPEARPAKD